MVRVLYEIDEEPLIEEVIEPNFLLTNKKGGYFLDYNSTKYRGLFSAEKNKSGWTLVKSVDTIQISGVPNEIVNRLWTVEKKYNETTERLFEYENSILYEVEKYKGVSILTLDVRDVNDFNVEGKKYTITKERDFIIIKFTQGTDFTRFIVIKSSVPYTVVNKWVEKEFLFDKKRKNEPSKWFVNRTLNFNIEGEAKIAISFSDDKEKAINEANYLFFSHAHLKNQKMAAVNSLFKTFKIRKPLLVAYKCCRKALDDLLISIDDMKGIYAGLPWFYQIWSRDEAISLGAFQKEKKYRIVKEIIFRSSSIILSDGRIQNRFPQSKLGSADGVGWLFKRAADAFYSQNSRKGSEAPWESHEISEITNRLKSSLEKMLKYYVKHSLTLNRKKETWMDTDVNIDPRDGARVEIQALTLCMLKLAKDMCKHIDDPDNKRYDKLEKKISKNIKKAFYKKGFLYDGFNDPTIRPNVFIAYYVYPNLLSTGEWKTVFKNTLKELWLDWGGIATIDKRHPLYTDEYTGMDDKSYHRGDSWYFLNNLVAICLYRVDKKMFSRYISKILDASTEEILRMGALGCHAEVSSAKEQRSEGAVSQAWSEAMYIEMIHELFG